MAHWIIGPDAVSNVAAIASRFTQLNQIAREKALGRRIAKYSPWLSVPAPVSCLEPVLAVSSQSSGGSLITNATYLAALTALLQESGNHAVSRIVPTDICVRLDVDVEHHLPDAAKDVEGSRDALANAAPWISDLYDLLIQCIVPITHHRQEIPVKRGFSSPSGFGAIFLTFEERDRNAPWFSIELAIDLAHEVAHHVLYAYQSADRILASDLEQPIYSGIKRTLRPAIMSLHANVALAYMIAAARAFRSGCQCNSSIVEWVEKLIASYEENQSKSLAELLENCQFTELGFAIVNELVDQLGSQSPLTPS